MTSQDMTYISYDGGDYSVDPTLYPDSTCYTTGEASNSCAQTYTEQYNDPSDAPASSSSPGYRCECGKTFRRKCDRDKHNKNHNKQRCPFAGCNGSGAENKDLNRHLWAKHPDYARQEGIPRVEQPCGWPGCNYYGRTDNLKRHRDSHNHWPAPSPS
ncbi:hypothetical protein QBC41DRAFT_148058 [Cercophora samala]|uniref:C2H2-type domain-containing protein n=1 Tax=Cercophora samala TaxID=330535 RepID=A0AA39Z998_9PEZI|nr:hypothetical protein QBC41DRAFT_148058 [Cercophora samala]